MLWAGLFLFIIRGVAMFPFNLLCHFISMKRRLIYLHPVSLLYFLNLLVELALAIYLQMDYFVQVFHSIEQLIELNFISLCNLARVSLGS